MIENILTPDFIKPILLTVHQQMVNRIFNEGKNAQGSLIGRYSDPYVKRRKRKGLGSSKKVVLEFTGQMRNDYLLLQDGDGFASGFTNSFNGDKSLFVEKTYNTSIFDLTEQEEKLLDDLVEQALERELDG